MTGATQPDADGVCVREVASTPAGFERELRQTWPGDVERETLSDGFLLRVHDEGVSLDILLTAQPERRIGLLTLPVSRAVYRFTGGDPQGHRHLLARLDQGMQRGGG